MIYRGTTEHEETVVGTLADIAARAAHLTAPAVIVIGEVVALRSLLARPLLDAVALDSRFRGPGLSAASHPSSPRPRRSALLLRDGPVEDSPVDQSADCPLCRDVARSC